MMIQLKEIVSKEIMNPVPTLAHYRKNQSLNLSIDYIRGKKPKDGEKY